MKRDICKILLAVLLIFTSVVFFGFDNEHILTVDQHSQYLSVVDVARKWTYSNQKKTEEVSIIRNRNKTARNQLISKTSIDAFQKDRTDTNQTKNNKNNNPIRIDDAGDRESENRCVRTYNIAFLKTHKCSSSTVQNVLMRYGVRYDLNFVLPPRGNYLGKTYFNKRFVMKLPVKQYNILCHHTVFSKEGFNSVMPANSVYVTIIRDPVTMYESLFSYYNYQALFQLPQSNALATFLSDPNRYYLPQNNKGHLKDPMLFDLGLDNDSKTKPSEVDQKIQQIASDFDLVMISEYLSESLILLKDLMCWDFADIVFLKMNARSKSNITTVTDTFRKKIREWNEGDVKLYDLFNSTFWEKVRAFGKKRMQREVKKLEDMNNAMQDKCIDKVVINDRLVMHPFGISVESYDLKDSVANDRDCQLIVKTEIPFTSYIRKRQYAKFANSSMH